MPHTKNTAIEKEVWEVVRNKGLFVDEIQTSQGARAVAQVWTRKEAQGSERDTYEVYPDGEARLHMMAAAPEMASALRALLDALRNGEGPSDAEIALAQHALDKSGGQLDF